MSETAHSDTEHHSSGAHHHHHHHHHRSVLRRFWDTVKDDCKITVRHRNTGLKEADIYRLIFLGASLVVIVLMLVFLKKWEARRAGELLARYAQEDQQQEEENLVRYNGKWYKENSDLETVLLLGIDRFEDGGEEYSQQADFAVLLVIDREKEKYTALQLNRDTMTEIPLLDISGEVYGSRVEQLALAYTYGSGGVDSCRNAAQAVSDLLFGVEIDRCISLTMDAVAEFNDLVGGVTVYVEDDFSQADPTIVQGQEVLLKGKQALTFVRSRSEMAEPTNLARMERQRVYMEALREKTLTCLDEDSEFPVRAMKSLSKYIVSDCTGNELISLLDTAAHYHSPEIQTVAGEAVEGERFMEFYVDEAALQKQTIELFFVETQK